MPLPRLSATIFKNNALTFAKRNFAKSTKNLSITTVKPFTKLEWGETEEPEFLPEVARVAAQPSQYITSPQSCALNATQKANIAADRVQAIVIDTVPNTKLNFFKSIRWSVQIPEGAIGIENRFCNPHSNYVTSAMLGVKKNASKQLVTSFPGIKITFIPVLDCNSSGYEPNLVAGLKAAIKLAAENPTVKYVVNWSILGSYNTSEKVALMGQLSAMNNVAVCIVTGNNDEQLDWCSLKIFNANQFIIGGTQDGNKLYSKSNVGPCASYYMPARYRSVINRLMIDGTSFAAPECGNALLGWFANNPASTRIQARAKLDSLAVTVNTTTKDGRPVQMKVFKKTDICTVAQAALSSSKLSLVPK